LEESVPFDATEFSKRLMNLGIETRPFFLGMHEQPVYLKMGLFKGTVLPITEWISRRGLYLPSGQAITDEQIDMVIEAIRYVLTHY